LIADRLVSFCARRLGRSQSLSEPASSLDAMWLPIGDAPMHPEYPCADFLPIEPALHRTHAAPDTLTQALARMRQRRS
jgi:hypothetical protein